MKARYDETIVFTPERNEGLHQSLAIASTTISSTPIGIGSQPTYVLLFSTSDCHIRFTSEGSDAVIADTFLPSGIQTPYIINSGFIISAIRDTTDGTLHISPVS